jgi:hypothetical protein
MRSPTRQKELLAQRQRRFRQRRRDHLVVVPVEVDWDILDLLTDLRVGWLLEADAESNEKIGEAIAKGLRLLAQERQRALR